MVYDRFGDFEGFCLLTEEGHERCYRSCEADVEALVRYAWAERIVVTVIALAHQSASQNHPPPDAPTAALSPVLTVTCHGIGPHHVPWKMVKMSGGLSVTRTHFRDHCPEAGRAREARHSVPGSGTHCTGPVEGQSRTGGASFRAAT